MYGSKDFRIPGIRDVENDSKDDSQLDGRDGEDESKGDSRSDGG